MLIVVLAYIWVFGRATAFIWYVKSEVAKNPKLVLVPVPLSDTSLPPDQGTTLTAFGYQFEVPWKMNEVKRKATIIESFQSESGQEILSLWDPFSKKGGAKIMRETPGGTSPAMAMVYGPTAIQSDYDFEQAIAFATPAQLSFFMPRVKEVRAGVFLLLKPLVTTDAETGFYSFQTEHLRGFQNGDPAKAKNVIVKAFDVEDRIFEFIFSNKSAGTGSITQADINMVMQTLRPAPASPSEPAVK